MNAWWKTPGGNTRAWTSPKEAWTQCLGWDLHSIQFWSSQASLPRGSVFQEETLRSFCGSQIHEWMRLRKVCLVPSRTVDLDFIKNVSICVELFIYNLCTSFFPFLLIKPKGFQSSRKGRKRIYFKAIEIAGSSLIKNNMPSVFL